MLFHTPSQAEGWGRGGLLLHYRGVGCLGCLTLIRQYVLCADTGVQQTSAAHMHTHTHLLVQCMELSVPPEHHPVVVVSENIHLIHLQQAQSDTHTQTHRRTHTHLHTHTVLQLRLPHRQHLAHRVGRRVRTGLRPFDGDMLHSRLPLLRGGGALPQGLPAWGEELVEGRHGQALGSRERMISLPSRPFCPGRCLDSRKRQREATTRRT